MKIELTIWGTKEWPRCYYDHNLKCGDPKTGALEAYNIVNENNPSWHVGNMCNCPSCPIRCAIRDALAKDNASS